MTTIVKVGCDRDVGEGTCGETAWGRVGETVEQTVARAIRVGWASLVTGRHECPWHAHGRYGGTGPL